MATLTREQLLRKPFSDHRNYPYGFSRSGDFSVRESTALLNYGSLITALLTGDLAAETDEDKALLAVAKSEKEPGNVIEKAWVKYQKRINRPKIGSVYGSSTKHTVTETDTDDSADYDDSADTDDDMDLDD